MTKKDELEIRMVQRRALGSSKECGTSYTGEDVCFKHQNRRWKLIWLFKLQDNFGMRTNGYKLSMNKFQMDIRKEFQTVRRVRAWSSLPIGVVMAWNLTPFMKEHTKFMDRLCYVGGWGSMWLNWLILKAPFRLPLKNFGIQFSNALCTFSM